MTEDRISEIASPFLEWTELGYAIIDKVGFARSLLAAGASEGQANLWARADYPVTWTRHGSGTNEWWSRDGYEARKTVSGRWVLSRAGLPIFEHEYLQEVMNRAFVLTQDAKAEIAALRERIAGMEKDAGWISVDDQLPDFGESVLVAWEDGGTDISYRYRHKGDKSKWSWTNVSDKYHEKPTYWMPLPRIAAIAKQDKETK